MMRADSLRSLVAVTALFAQAAVADYGESSGTTTLPYTPEDEVVTVVVHSTITTCPVPPPPCSSTSDEDTTTTVTITTSATSTVTTTTSSSFSSFTFTNGTTTTSPTTTGTGSSSSSSSSSDTSLTVVTSTTTSQPPPACTDYWLGEIDNQGVAPFAPAGYEVFRNVKDYGAVGDGVADDTAAINRAISYVNPTNPGTVEDGRCGPGTCNGSTITPALVYFPPGTYLVSSPIIDYYYTQVIGNPGCLPVIKATADFEGRWVFDSNPYQPGGRLAWMAVNVFWRQVANFVFDLRSVPATTLISGIHWPSSQATSLQNIEIRLSEAANTLHQGVFIEEGSGGFVGDIVIYGGAQALAIGNQQFTFRNITIFNAKTAIEQIWDWGWTYIGVSINNCTLGFDFRSTTPELQLNVASATIIDSEINNTPIGIAFGNSSATGPPAGNSLMLENINLNNVPVAIQGPDGPVLPGSSGAANIAAWGRGNAYTPTGPSEFEGVFTPNDRPSKLLAGTDYYTRSKPQYVDVPVSGFLSAREVGCVGDGVTDDTDRLQGLIDAATRQGLIVYINAGYYRVTRTIVIPAGARLYGEAYPIILSSGAFFDDASNPQPVVQIGEPGEAGSIEWSNTIVSGQGRQSGAIMIQYNLVSPSSQPSGLWDVHVRVGGFAGSELQLAECAKTPEIEITPENLDQDCVAAFLSFYIPPGASGLLMENCWVWVADHDMEVPANNQQITVYAGRGMLVESVEGAIWLYGTGVEHHQMYEYQLVGSGALVMGQIQTESAYYQPNPDAQIPYAPEAQWNDPVFSAGESGWGLRVVDSNEIFVYGAGLYSFFDNYSTNCSQIGAGAVCQSQIFSVEGSTSISIYNLNTIGTTNMATVDGVDVASFADNMNGFVQTIALFRTNED